MYKTRLQDLCQQNQLRLPEYATTRQGPDHNPRFRASVTVGGLSFESQDPATSAKEAQNRAAQVAVEHFASAVPDPVTAQPSAQPIENKISYKSQLQNFVQRKILDPPVYNSISEGPPHALRFKATVRVDGQKFESPQFCKSLREAEHSAAEVVLLSFSFVDRKQGEPSFYKNILQELAQKERFSLPKYTTIRDGACHMPNFFSKVEIEGQIFEGDAANTKKQAEMNAAKVAWSHLKERKLSRPSGLCFSKCKVEEIPLPTSSVSPTEFVVNFPQSGANLVEKSTIKIGEGTKAISVGSDEVCTERNRSQYKTLLPPAQPDNFDHPMASPAAPSAEFPVDWSSSSLLCKRVRVYPRKPNLIMPEGATTLLFSDEMWVVVSLDFSHQDGASA